MSFKILQHLDSLTPDGGSSRPNEGSYLCPACESSNFKVDLKTGQYGTYGCDCAQTPAGKRKIRDAIAPLTWEKPPRPPGKTTFTYDELNHGVAESIVEVVREDDGNGKRQFYQRHWNGQRWVRGVPDYIKAQIRLYRIFSPVNEQAKGQRILLVEGEGKVDALLGMGIPATCAIGGAGKWQQYGYLNYLEDLKGYQVVLCPDRDEPGVKHCATVAADLEAHGIAVAGWLYAFPKSPLWNYLPRNKGADIVDWLAEGGTADEIWAAIEPRRQLSQPKQQESTQVEQSGKQPAGDADELAIRKARALPPPPGAIAPKGAFDGLVWVGDNGTPKLAKAGKLAIAMERHWGDHLRYRQDLSGWFQYEATTPGLWERVSDREIRALIQRELDMAGADGCYTQGTIDSTAALLSQRVAIRQWQQPRNLIPFQNGVLDLKTSTLHPHHHRWGFTWQLPYRHEPTAIADPFIEWLGQMVGGDPSVMQLIRAILRAIITGQTQYQRYLELIGPGGTGKGTLIRVIQALLGMRNAVSTSFQRIATNRFETSRFIEKRMVLIPDADYNPTAIDVLKQLTGGDLIPYERKNENSDFMDGFTLSGWVVIATNRATIATDGTNALFRRRLPVYFNRVVPEGQRRCLLDIDPDGNPRGEFAALLPGIFNWVLAMPDELMDAYIRCPDRYVEAIGEYQAETLLNTDSLAQWVNDMVIYAPGTWAKTGDRNSPHRECLYPSYLKFCEATGAKPLAIKNFSTALADLFQHQLGHQDVTRARKGDRGYGLKNIRLRAINADPTNETLDRPVEPAPRTVERALGIAFVEELPSDDGEPATPEAIAPLSDRQLTRLLNLGCDDRETFTQEVKRLTPTEKRFLYTQLPELREVPHVV